jgi:hypothetical protein
MSSVHATDMKKETTMVVMVECKKRFFVLEKAKRNEKC